VEVGDSPAAVTLGSEVRMKVKATLARHSARGRPGPVRQVRRPAKPLIFRPSRIGSKNI